MSNNTSFPMGVRSEEEKDARVVETNASQYFLLNSMDRLQNSSINEFNAFTAQNWNDFRLQKPAYLMNAFAQRISISEIRFPWFIPNITARNNFLYVNPVFPAGAEVKIEVPIGFYTPAELIATLNDLLDTAFGVGALVVSYDNINQRYTFTPDAGKIFTIGYVPFGVQESAVDYYTRIASLLRTMGMELNQQAVPFGDALIGSPTNTVYTDFVDICSSKLMMNTDAQDGTSANEASKTSVVCRVFLADESSQVTSAPLGSRPMLIHRQFVNPKQTKWSNDQFIDWLDIQVYDQFGQLVPLNTYTVAPGTTVYNASYPDFQITCLASEN